jgi:hypothetical protein
MERTPTMIEGRVYHYDEVRDQKTYTMHKVDFVRAFDAVASNAGGPLPSMDFINEVLDRLDSDWDDDSDGIDSYWLEDKCEPR